MNTYIVYKHTNKINNKVYIGITKNSDNPNARWRNGFGYEKNKKFFTEIVQYGWDNFTHEILASELNELEALEQERFYIKKYNCVENGYNNSYGGNIPSEQGKQALTIALTGLKRDRKSIEKQMVTKHKRYGSGRGAHYLGTQAKKVKCNETGDVFASIQEANRWSNTSKVGECCKGNRVHAGTHPLTGQQLSWSYADVNSKITINCEMELKPRKTIQRVQCIETQKIYENASEASRDTGVAVCNILRVCRGERKSAGKLHWIFI